MGGRLGFPPHPLQLLRSHRVPSAVVLHLVFPSLPLGTRALAACPPLALRPPLAVCRLSPSSVPCLSPLPVPSSFSSLFPLSLLPRAAGPLSFLLFPFSSLLLPLPPPVAARRAQSLSFASLPSSFRRSASGPSFLLRFVLLLSLLRLLCLPTFLLPSFMDFLAAPYCAFSPFPPDLSPHPSCSFNVAVCLHDRILAICFFDVTPLIRPAPIEASGSLAHLSARVHPSIFRALRLCL